MCLVMLAAHKLEMVTGCKKRNGDINGDMFWEKRLGILDDVKAGRKKIAYGIGIGYPQADKERWQTDETELAIGYHLSWRSGACWHHQSRIRLMRFMKAGNCRSLRAAPVGKRCIRCTRTPKATYGAPELRRMRPEYTLLPFILAK